MKYTTRNLEATHSFRCPGTSSQSLVGPIHKNGRPMRKSGKRSFRNPSPAIAGVAHAHTAATVLADNAEDVEAFYLIGDKRIGVRRRWNDGTLAYEWATDGNDHHGR